MNATTADHVRFHCWLLPRTHRILRVQAAIEGRTIRAVTEDAINAYCQAALAVEDDLEDHNSR